MMEFGQFGPDFLPFGPFRSLRPPEIPASFFIAVPSVFITRSRFFSESAHSSFIAVPFGFWPVFLSDSLLYLIMRLDFLNTVPDKN